MLYGDEFALVKTGGAWHVVVGASSTLSGKYPALPGVMSPGAAVFRLTWDENCGEGAAPEPSVLTIVHPLRWSARLQALALFVIVPAALFVNVAAELMFMLLALLYGLTAASLCYVARRRSELGISRKDFASIAFDVLACPPFAINLVRRITVHGNQKLCGRAFASQVLAPEVFERAKAVIDSRLAQSRGPETEQCVAKPNNRDDPT